MLLKDTNDIHSSALLRGCTNSPNHSRADISLVAAPDFQSLPNSVTDTYVSQFGKSRRVTSNADSTFTVNCIADCSMHCFARGIGHAKPVTRSLYVPARLQRVQTRVMVTSSYVFDPFMMGPPAMRRSNTPRPIEVCSLHCDSTQRQRGGVSRPNLR